MGFQKQQRGIVSMQKYLLVFLFFANIIDTVVTDMGLRHGVIGEANPLIAKVYEQSILLYYFAKIVGVSTGLLLVTKVAKSLGKSRAIGFTLIFASGVYGYVLGLHTIWVSLWLAT